MRKSKYKCGCDWRGEAQRQKHGALTARALAFLRSFSSSVNSGVSSSTHLCETGCDGVLGTSAAKGLGLKGPCCDDDPPGCLGVFAAEAGVGFSSPSGEETLVAEATERGRAAEDDFKKDDGVDTKSAPPPPTGGLNFIELPPTGLNFFKLPGFNIVEGELSLVTAT